MLRDFRSSAGSHHQSLTTGHLPVAWRLKSTILALLPDPLNEPKWAYEIKLTSSKEPDQSLNSVFSSSNVLYFLLGAFTEHKEWCSISCSKETLVNSFPLFLFPALSTTGISVFLLETETIAFFSQMYLSLLPRLPRHQSAEGSVMEEAVPPISPLASEGSYPMGFLWITAEGWGSTEVLLPD